MSLPTVKDLIFELSVQTSELYKRLWYSHIEIIFGDYSLKREDNYKIKIKTKPKKLMHFIHS